MLSAAWFLFKSVLGQILAFIIKHWRIILPILILGYCLIQYKAQVNRADEAIQALNEYISAAHTARAQRNRENLQKDSETKVALAKVLADHQVSLARLNLDRQRETKQLKDLYENKILAHTRNWSDRVQLESQRGKTADGLPDFQAAAGEFAQGLRDCDAAYTILENSCQITTVDYNTLWTAWDEQCQVIGCD